VRDALATLEQQGVSLGNIAELVGGARQTNASS
jgi:hypothetical protein